ncbi:MULTISPECIES: ABC transporter permease [unclassified Motilimonas]|uniref:ABC transporter permease n=1 Tax=unclassified Motilimonas TaxID=2643697 RepID=UPI001E4A0DFA|nr:MULTISPECIES: ABC transporter permease [unclassified Motilimonas]MCE0558539.1 ABC transporter permease [Motilimonas sp. E26]MDO6527426.1 ABC transporter permease [Motilimonas sp. 1_MG-2023]
MLNIVAAPIKHRTLIWAMAKREIATKYKGSILGVFWSFLNPLLMLAIYTFVFKYIFKSKWGVPEGAVEVDFATLLFAGLLLHGWLAEVFSRSVSLIMNNVNLVKKVKFPLEILPWVTLVASGIQLAIGFVVLFTFMLYHNIAMQWQLLLVPLLLLPLAFFLLGASWLTAALGVFIRDIEQFMISFITVLLFTSTIFFSLDNAPALIQPILQFNPLTIPVEALRNAAIFGLFDSWGSWTIYSVVSLLFMIFGYYVFKRLKPLFSDVL